MATPAEGYVDPITIAEREKEVDLIDQHYSSLLSPAFYTTFGFGQQAPMSKILQRTQAQDQNGDFLMLSSTYIELLADLQTVHTDQAVEQEVTDYLEEIRLYYQAKQQECLPRRPTRPHAAQAQISRGCLHHAAQMNKTL